MRDLAGRRAVVTGGGSGIGRSIAHSLARTGVAVGVADIDRASADTVAAEITAADGRAAAFRADVSDFASMNSLADEAYETLGEISILVNNAGVTLRPLRALWETSPEDFRWLMDVNFLGVVHGFSAFVPRMRRLDGAKHIMSTSSLATLTVRPGHSAYTASKSAVDGYLRVAAHELTPEGFEVSVLYPGVVRTKIGDSERHRPAPERSSSRDVTAWEDHLRSTGIRPDVDEQGRQRDSVVNDPIDPDRVGPLVVRAIRQGSPYVMTHPVPDAEIDRYADLLKAASAECAAGWDVT